MIGVAKDKVEEAKLELVQARKGFEDELARALAQAIEDFKKSEEFGTLLGQYGSSSYHYSLRLARLFLRTKLLDDLNPVVEGLRTFRARQLSRALCIGGR